MPLKMLSLALLALSFSLAAVATPHEHAEKRQVLGLSVLPVAPATPTVMGASPRATYIGSSSSGIDTFNGMPFAVPPVNKNRLYAPSSISSALGTVHATGVPAACPQQLVQQPNTTLLPPAVVKLVKEIPAFKVPAIESEDCLTINIQRPAGTTSNDSLPVVFWIYGGGFEFGSTSTYDGSNLIRSSVAEGAPIIYAQANYRVSGWGFLAGSEVKKGGVSNLGLLDQRLALQWLADNIASFGGDPSKVTIWGESAGSISVFDQMALYGGNNTYKGKPLFRAAIMDSGSIVPADPVDGTKGQAVYNQVVTYAGCNGAANTLQCLRGLSYAKFSAAVDSLPGIFGYDSVALAYLPRPDGVVLPDSPDVLAKNGKFTPIPYIIGDQEDEGTLFSLFQANLTTSADLVNYLSTVFFPFSPKSRIQGLVNSYPNRPAAGSPFRTGALNNVYPQYKRLAAILGDITFTLVRRAFLSDTAAVYPNLPTYSYLASYFYLTPVLGTFHATDLLTAYGTLMGNPYSTISTYYISFINTMDPNALKSNFTVPQWPRWSENHTLVQFQADSNNYLADNFRNASYSFLINPANTLRI